MLKKLDLKKKIWVIIKRNYSKSSLEDPRAAVMYTIVYNYVQIINNNKKYFPNTVYKIPIVLHRNVYMVQCTLFLYTLWSKNAGNPGRPCH